MDNFAALAFAVPVPPIVVRRMTEAFPTGLPLPLTRYLDDQQNVKSYATLGQLTYDFSDQFSLTAGLRYSKERKKYHRFTYTV